MKGVCSCQTPFSIYTWAIGNERSLIVYIVVDNWLRLDVLEAKVMREMCNSSDHFGVAKLRMSENLEFTGSRNKENGRKDWQLRLHD